MDTKLAVRSLNYSYLNGPTISFPDIDLIKGDHLLILGNSGVGKTTLLHLIAGLLVPTSGTVTVNTEIISLLSEHKRDRFRAVNMGLVFQSSHLVQSLTLMEHLFMIQSLAGKKIDKKKCYQVLDRLGLKELANRKPHQLSQGQRQRASLSFAVINDPFLMLVDEPTSNLDDDSSTQVIDLLKETSQQAGSSLIVITHDQRIKSEFPKSITL